jgi:NHLM bacteriocin system ABC transporter ATP-binding protein
MGDSFQSIAWLKQRLGNACTDVLVQGDQPLLLDDPSCAYLTLSEHHQLFCVSYRDGKAVGRREHVAICRPGQLLFGLLPGTGKEATALVLSGVTGSIVWRVPTALLFRLMNEQEGRQVVERLFNEWLMLLIQTLPLAPVPTRHHALSPGETVEVDSVPPPSSYAFASVSAYFRRPSSELDAIRLSGGGAFALTATEGVLWIAPPNQPRAYRGIDLAAEEGAGVECWPLTPNAWALVEGGPIRAWSTADLLLASGGPGFADGFYAFVVSIVARRRARLTAARLERDELSHKAERSTISNALAKLARVGSGERLAPDLGTGDPFDQTCRVIAHYLGVDAPHVVAPTGDKLSHMQTALSRLTGIRTRNVLLEGKWYEHESGPLLGFLLEPDEAVHPVAILPYRAGYTVQDPRDGSERRVNASLAELLHPHAYQFYAPAPAKPMGPLDVLRFASWGTRRDVLFVIFVGLATGSIGTLIPLLTGQVFDRIIPGAEKLLLRDLTLVMLAVYLSLGIFDVARGFVLVRAQTRMDTTLEAGVWDRLLNLPLPFFRQYSAGDLASRAAGIGAIREVLAGTSMTVMLGGLFSAWNFGLLFYIDPTLALASTGLVMLAGVVAGLAAYYALKRQRIVAEIDGKIGGLILQLLSGIPKLRVTGSENRAFGVWSKLFSERRDADLGAERVNIRVGVFQAAFPTLCSMTLFWLLAGAGGQTLTTGQFLAFSAAFGTFLGAVLNVIETGLHSLTVIPMYERAKPILAHELESQGRSDVRTELRGSIEVSHLSFRYQPESPLVLDDVNIRIEPNEFVAFVGPSGSGKSTLLRLLLGFEQPTEGGVFFDGQALSSLDLRQVRQQIGVVLQNSRVTAGDVYTNIVGNTGLTLEDAWRAARSAALAKDIEAMPMGMHTVISQGGGTLSGGQRQRLLIARALASRPRILFFDEATSALDNVTQAAVSESLETLRVTRVVIAHRLTTIQRADKIVVLEGGRVVEMGAYNELMQRDGVFRSLARRQTV